jgi:ubiquinone biosynthesis protein
VLSGLAAAARLAAAAGGWPGPHALLPRGAAPPLRPRAWSAFPGWRGVLAGPSSRRGRPGERLARSLEGMGPVAIKLGQLLSTGADIFGVEFARTSPG